MHTYFKYTTITMHGTDPQGTTLPPCSTTGNHPPLRNANTAVDGAAEICMVVNVWVWHRYDL